MLVTTTNNFFEKQQTFYATKDSLVAFIRQNERGPVQVFEQVNFFNRAFLDIEKIDPVGFEESSIFKIAELFTRYVEKVTDVDLKDSSFIVTKNNASLSYHVIFDYALDSFTLRATVALFKALYPWSGVIDDVVYSTGRLFKCVGSYKPGILTEGTTQDPETYHVVIRPCGARVPLGELGDEEIASSLISNLEGAKVLSILKTKTKFTGHDSVFTTSLTIDGVAKTLTTKKMHCRNKGVYSTVLNASEVNKLFSIERIACVETKSTTVKREEYIDLSNYCNNYNLRLDSTEGLKVYDENLNEITEGLDKLLLRCLLSRDISLKVKYDDYIALAGNIRSVTWDEYRLFRSASSLLGIELNRAFHTCENAVVNHIRQKFLDNGVPKDIFYKRNRYFTPVRDEPKFGNTKSLYSLAEIEEKGEFLCLENERYKALKFDALPFELWEFPSLYFTKGDYIAKSSNAMFRLFINKNSKIRDYRKSSRVNPYACGPQDEESDEGEGESEGEGEGEGEGESEGEGEGEGEREDQVPVVPH